MRRLSIFAFAIFALALAPALAKAQPAPPTQCVSSALAGGTGDAITVPLLPCSVTTTLLLLKLSAANTTTTPTIQMIGAAAQTIIHADTTAIQVQELQPEVTTLLTNNGTNWIKLVVGFPVTNVGLASMPSTTVKCNPLGIIGPVQDCTGPALQAIGIVGNPLISDVLTGNPSSPTVVSSLFQGTATAGLGKRQVEMSIGIANTVTASTICVGGGADGSCDMIGQYIGVILGGGQLNGFVGNRLLTVSSGWDAANIAGLGVSGGAWIDELDVNNLNKNFGETLGPGGLAPPFTYGINLTSTGNDGTFFRNTAAIVISGVNSASYGWNRGVVCEAIATGGDIAQACYSDYSSSPIVLDIWGTHGTAAIDGSHGTFTTNFIRGPGASLWSGTGKIAGLLLQTTGIYSVAGVPLPTCNSAAEGTHATVSDAMAWTNGAAYTGGGAVHAPVYCDSVSWKTD